MTNVVNFPGRSSIDSNPEQILDQSKDRLSAVVVVGETKDGEFYFASSQADGADALYWLEMGKYKLIRMCNGDDE